MSQQRDSRKESTLGRQAAKIGCLVLCFPILVLAAPLILAFMLWDNYRVAAFKREFRRRWPGKRGILVYSNSPNWQEYIEHQWLPRIGTQFVLLNWSDRAKWAVDAPFEARVFRRFAGDQEFNPIAIVFLPPGRAARFHARLESIRKRDPRGVLEPSPKDTVVIRFFQAFKDFKHGKDHLLHTKEAELFALCDDAKPANGAEGMPLGIHTPTE